MTLIKEYTKKDKFQNNFERILFKIDIKIKATKELSRLLYFIRMAINMILKDHHAIFILSALSIIAGSRRIGEQLRDWPQQADSRGRQPPGDPGRPHHELRPPLLRLHRRGPGEHPQAQGETCHQHIV